MKIDITRRGLLAGIGATAMAPSALAQGAGQAGYRALVMRKMAKALGFCALASA